MLAVERQIVEMRRQELMRYDFHRVISLLKAGLHCGQGSYVDSPAGDCALTAAVARVGVDGVVVGVDAAVVGVGETVDPQAISK